LTNTRATALAGVVVIAAVIVMCVWEWGHGRDGTPYVQLGAIAGVAYLAALALLRLRS
jgi:presenilin-like A22 family membrane protease